MTGFLRLKQISSLLQLNAGDTQKLFTYKHRKKLYSHFDSVWYEFKNMKDVIVPVVQVQKVMNNHNNHPTVQSLSPKLKSQFPNLLPQITKYCKEPRIASSSSSKQINKIIPVIAILGHFDHGKTTLLDALGATNCLSLDFNGVTQSVRTQLVPLPILMNSSPSRSSKYWVTFVDTPGQEFFYRMRNFGASVADAVVLVVSVQEGVCLQTEESIGIVESMNVPVIVVINKIDTLPDNEASERITQLKSLLSEYKALSSASFVTVSALKKTNLDQLQHTLCQLFHQSDTFSTSTDFETPIFEWPSHYFNHINQIMTVAAAGEAQNKIKFDQLDKCKSTGVLLNLWKNKIDGTAMHILLNQGTVSVGDCFSSGGWSGTVKRVFVSAPDESTSSIDASIILSETTSKNNSGTATNSAKDKKYSVGIKFAEVNYGPPGVGLKVVIQLHDGCAEPRPQGGSIYFFPKYAADEADCFADQKRMIESFESHLLSSDTARAYLLPQFLFKKKSHVADIVTDSDVDEIDANNEQTQDSSLQNDSNDFTHVVLKVDSDIILGTIADAVEDVSDSNENPSPETADTHVVPYLPHKRYKIVSQGIGDVSINDISIAHAAEGVVCMYGVAIDSQSTAQAKKYGIKIIRFDLIQDLLNHLRG